jgi:hypothetical protein
MGLSVCFVSGPRFSGKSVVIRSMIDRLWKSAPHFLRLVEVGGDKKAPRFPAAPPPDSGVASARSLEYEPERIFEILPEALTAIHKKDRYGGVIIEADTDRTLLCAYPYDHRLFVMPVPTAVEQVFRTARAAAAEMQTVLADTAAFASQIYGLFDGDSLPDCDPKEERDDLTGTQMRRFLASPLGDEIATRVALQPAYHGLVESDVVLVNTGLATPEPTCLDCLRQIERLLGRLRKVAERQTRLYMCNPLDPRDRIAKKFFRELKSMCKGGR